MSKACTTHHRSETGRCAGRASSPMLALFLASALILPAIALGVVQSAGNDAEAARYIAATPNDPVARLQKQIDAGTIKLEYDPRRGYLPSVLRALGAPASSQILVWSKTSFQFKHISPRTPRALYFADDAVIGWVPGGEVMEIAAQDPELGAVFYTIPQRPAAKPKFQRQTSECLQCHQGAMTQGVPGHFMRSVYARIDGKPELNAGSYLTTDRSPFEERWGGWYVTGQHGRLRHMGNVFATRTDFPEQIDLEAGANVTDLGRFMSTEPYLQKTSDIVALMVAEHQGNTLNVLAKAAMRARQALAAADANKPHSPETLHEIRQAAEPVVEALLFSGEARITDRIVGSAAFAAQFQEKGPRDAKGRSLRHFDLARRLFRYPCSYLIYSRPFDALPPVLKEAVFSRLTEVLSGKDQTRPFAHLSGEDRTAIQEILLQTKPDYAAFTGAKSGTEHAAGE